MAGVAAGKSNFGPKWHLKRCVDNPKSAISLVVAPDYRLLRSRCLAEFETFLTSRGYREGKHFRIYLSSSDLKIVLNLSGHKPWNQTIYFWSGEAPHKMVALNASHAWIDEAGLLSDDVIMRLVQRIRCPEAVYRQCLWTGTPEGIGNAFVNRFHPDECKPDPNDDRFSESEHKLVLHAATFDNTYLPADFVQNLAREFGLDSPEFACYVLGRPTSLSRDRFYYGFVETKNVGSYPPMPENRGLIVAFDNNPVVLAWTAVQRDADRYLVVADNGGNARDLYEACEQFIEKFPPPIWRTHEVSVLGDAALYTRSPLTHNVGFDIIRTLLKPYYPLLSIDAPRRASLVRERFRCTNTLYRDGRLLVDRSCLKTIESAKSVEMGSDGKPKKKQGEKLSHAMESLDHALIHLEPPTVQLEYAGLK